MSDPIVCESTYTVLPDAIISAFARDLTPASITVYLALVHYSNRRTATCWPSMTQIANRALVSVNTARSEIHRLMGMGLIERRERSRPDGTRTSNLYYLPSVERLMIARETAQPRGTDSPTEPDQYIAVEAEQSIIVHTPDGGGYPPTAGGYPPTGGGHEPNPIELQVASPSGILQRVRDAGTPAPTHTCTHESPRAALSVRHTAVSRSAEPDLAAEFESLWLQYPRQIGRADALRAYTALRRDSPTRHTPAPSYEDIQGRLVLWLASSDWQGGFVHNMARWLREGIWAETPRDLKKQSACTKQGNNVILTHTNVMSPRVEDFFDAVEALTAQRDTNASAVVVEESVCEPRRLPGTPCGD